MSKEETASAIFEKHKTQYGSTDYNEIYAAMEEYASQYKAEIERLNKSLHYVSIHVLELVGQTEDMQSEIDRLKEELVKWQNTTIEVCEDEVIYDAQITNLKDENAALKVKQSEYAQKVKEVIEARINTRINKEVLTELKYLLTKLNNL